MWLCHQVTFESLLADSSLGQAHALSGTTCGPSSHENPTHPAAIVAQLLSHVWLFVIPWTAARQAHLSSNTSRSLPKLMSIESVTPSNHLILCRLLLLWPSIFPSSRVFSSESPLCITWPKYWNFNFSISPCNEYSGLISFRMDWLISLQSKGHYTQWNITQPLKRIHLNQF